MFNLIFISLITCATSLLLVKYFLYFESIADYFISFFILFFTQIVLSLQLLGILNVLYLNNVIILNLCILIIMCTVIIITKRTPKDDLWAKFRYAINNISFSKVEIICLSIILGFGLVKIFINLINPPLGWDDLNYHFTFPIEWLKHGNLENPIVVSCDPSPTYYPINGSIFFLWLILPLKNVFIADLGQVPFFVLAFIAIYSLVRKLNLSKENAVFSASIFTLVPNYFKQLEVAYVDVMIAALFLVALNYLFLLYKQGYLRNIILYSISVGLMLGTKTTAVPYTFLLFIPFLFFCFTKFNFKKSTTLFFLCILLIALTGGFSYVRNFIQTGNSLYPLNLNLFNRTIFKGVIDSYVYRAHFLPQDYNLTKILFSEGLGAQTVIFFIPAILLGLPTVIIKKKKYLSFNFIYFMILPFLLIFTYRFIIPLANLRYLYSLLGIGFIISFYVAEALNVPQNILKVLIVICVLASVAELAAHIELVISLMLSVILFFAFPYLLKLIKYKKIARYIVFILILLCLLLIILEKDYVKNEYSRYISMVDYSGFWPEATKAWAWLNQNTKGNNIAYIGRPVPFPLLGTYFKNNVYYVSVNEVEPAKLHYFQNSKYVWGYDGESVHMSFEKDINYRGKADYNIWLNNFSRRKTDYLFVYSLHQIKTIEFPIEDKWANSHLEIFDLLFSNDIIHIYKIKK